MKYINFSVFLLVFILSCQTIPILDDESVKLQLSAPDSTNFKRIFIKDNSFAFIRSEPIVSSNSIVLDGFVEEDFFVRYKLFSTYTQKYHWKGKYIYQGSIVPLEVSFLFNRGSSANSSASLSSISWTIGNFKSGMFDLQDMARSLPASLVRLDTPNVYIEMTSDPSPDFFFLLKPGNIFTY